VSAERTLSRSRNNPYEGLELPGQVVATFLRGRQTHGMAG
jgi:dihydroorotase